jgi:outer membrane autotransporter protein
MRKDRDQVSWIPSPARRVALMMTTSILSLSAYGSLRSAQAANECGVIAVGGTATCTPAGNSFPNGIDYDVNDATLVIQDGVTINTSANNVSGISNGSGAVNHGNLATTTQGTVSITTSGDGAHGIAMGTGNGNNTITGSANTAISTSGASAHGILVRGYGGNVAVNTPGSIATSGNGAYGIGSYVYGGNLSIDTGTVSSSGVGGIGILGAAINGTVDITTTGITSANGYGIQTYALGAGSGDVNVTSTGGMTTYGFGVAAIAQVGNINVDLQSPITVTGPAGFAVFANTLAGDITLSSSGITTASGTSAAIYAISQSGAINITDTGTLNAANSTGIYAYAQNAALNINVNNLNAGSYGIYALGRANVAVTTNGAVSTTGDNISAIYATSLGSVTVTANGAISATGINSDGIQAYAVNGMVTVNANDISTSDDGILAYGATGATINALGTITSGDEGMEIVTGAGGNTLINVNNVTAIGDDNDAIRVTSGGTVTINVNGTVLGGANSSSGAGIDIRASTGTTININSGGSVNAVSGFAIVNSSTGLLTINNLGTLNGSHVFGGGNDAFNNLSINSVNLSRYIDTNVDGIRDTEAVAILDFGAGVDTFNNSATGALRLSTVIGATAFNTTNETFATGSAGLSLTNAGIEQGHILNLETFLNSGIISLADAETGGATAIAGDVLVITSLGAPGLGGTSNFVSNGGQLHLDTVLNNGAIDTTDVLIVDTVTTGTGATAITITNAGGTGAATGTGATDGIRLVEVRGTGSASDAFILSAPVIAGNIEYELNQADGQNWYLQSDGSIAKQIPAYQAVPLALAGFARNQMPWAQTRWGETGAKANQKSGAWIQGGYVRAVAEFGNSNQFESRNRFGQAGYDLGLGTALSGALSVGAMLQHTSTDTKITNGNGSDFSASGYGAGVNALWSTKAGLFIEALATFNYFDIGFNRTGLADVANTHAQTYGAGLQVGQKFNLTNQTTNWSVTPRASVTYIDSVIDGFTDASNLAIDFGDNDSLLVEGSIISNLDLQLEGNRVLTLTTEVGLEHDVSNSTRLTANGAAFAAEDSDTKGILNAGASLNLGHYASLFARGKFIGSFDGDDQSLQGNAGVRVKF